MRIIHDSDTVEFVDPSGDKLILLVCPRQRDRDAAREIERKCAIAQMDNLKALGVDFSAAVAEATPEEIAAATQDVSDPLSDEVKVRESRLSALAIRLIVNGEAIGGKAILDAYRDMDQESARWIDTQVAATWTSALPSEADTRGSEAVPEVPECASDGPTS